MQKIIVILLSCMVVIEGAHLTSHVLKNDVHGWVIQYCDK
jgi:hypothetical protein